jgi:hypothetical protein
MFAEKFPYRSFVKQRSTKNPKDIINTPIQFKVMFNNSDQTICCNIRLIFADADYRGEVADKIKLYILYG